MNSAQENWRYVQRWRDATTSRISRAFLIGAFVYAVLGAPVIPAVLPEAAAGLLQIPNFTCMFFSGLALLYHWRTKKRLDTWCKVTMIASAVAIGICVNLVLRRVPDQTSNWRYVITCIGFPGIFSLLWPDFRYRSLAAIVLFFGFSLIGIQPGGIGGHELSVIVTAVFIVMTAKITLIRFLTLVAEQEMRIERLAKESERGAIEKEMDVARRIQDSYSDDQIEMASGRHRITWFQTRHGVVGGDWVTTRILADGRTVAMVVDAAGKGLQAALVVHAVQSLWADAMGQSEFSPKDWIRRVNAMLLSLGRKAPHSVTLGLVIIDKERLEYWSAGHVPLYGVMKLAGMSQARRIFGHGSMLGITGDYDIQPEVLDLGGHEVDVILCSDGLNPGGGILRKRQIEELVAEVNARGFDAMREVPSDDDRSVVWIKAA